MAKLVRFGFNLKSTVIQYIYIYHADITTLYVEALKQHRHEIETGILFGVTLTTRSCVYGYQTRIILKTMLNALKL